MKNKKTLYIIGGTILAVVLAVILIVCAVGSKTSDTPQNTPDTGENTSVTVDDISVDDPKNDDPTTGGAPDGETEGTRDGSIVTLAEPTETSSDPAVSTEPAEKADSPVAEQAPTDNGNGGGITIGGGQTETYDCGVAGHHCDGPETHAYVTNLELEGCPYCGKHDCASFYATDEWGNTCYTPNKCPKYDIHSDPVYYCQDCGKPTGDGSHDTCVQFVVADNCPNCGAWVEAWKCHTCKE